jgi:ankyrin repeat protein
MSWTDENELIQKASNGKLEKVKLLVKGGVDINANNDEALVWAARNNHLEVVKFLVKIGANINANNGQHTQIVKFLKSYKIGTIIHVEGEWPLQVAARHGNLEVVKFLVKHGADVHTEDDFALQCADCNGHTEVVEFLKQQKNKPKKVEPMKQKIFKQKNQVDIVKSIAKSNP